MRVLFIAICLFVYTQNYSQTSSRISTVDFVQVVNNNKKEAFFYYNNNWKVLREMAVNRGFISSFEFMETAYSEEAPFHFILITTYLNKEQFDLREAHFQELIKERGELKLLNDLQPGDFRKNLYHKEEVRHLN